MYLDDHQRIVRNRGTALLFLILPLWLTVGTRGAATEVGTACPEVPSKEGARRKLAGEWFGRGQAAADNGQYILAVESFECSIRMVAHPDTVFNAAKAARLAGDDKRALGFARQYLEMMPEGEVANEVTRMIEELEASAALQEDAAASSPGTAAGDGSGDSSPLDDSQGETPSPETSTEASSPVAGPEDTAPPAPTDGAPSPPAPGSSADEPRSKWFVAGTVTLGVGVAGLVVGAVMQGLASKAWADGKDTDNYSEFIDCKDRLSGFQTAALAGLISGGIVSGVGVILLIVGQRRNKRERPLGLRPSGVGIAGRF